jgi:uncharacterized phage protein (TIGR01671 family)
MKEEGKEVPPKKAGADAPTAQRPIKFRAWCLITREMYDLIEINARRNEHYIGFLGNPSWGARQRLAKDIRIMQFAGLQDKNGRDIYEGDIIKYSDLKHPYGPVEYVVGVVEFGSFSVDTGTMGHGMGSGKEDIVGFFVRRKYGNRPTLINGMESVVGNVYENPELAGTASP